jgi:SAM-dependent methyltransferase
MMPDMSRKEALVRVNRFRSCVVLFCGLVLASAVPALAQQSAELRRPDVIFVPTPQAVVEAMLKVTKVGPKDVVYDLGCGDGRIVITAVKEYGARGVGIDIDPQRIKEATENAEKQGVKLGDRLEIKQADLFETDLSPASVVTLYLLPSLNLKLRPKLWRELKVGSRVVSHAFDMGDDWPPDETINADGRMVYYWLITDAVKKRAGAGQ